MILWPAGAPDRPTRTREIAPADAGSGREGVHDLKAFEARVLSLNKMMLP
jgi:hypothetical protein